MLSLTTVCVDSGNNDVALLRERRSRVPLKQVSPYVNRKKHRLEIELEQLFGGDDRLFCWLTRGTVDGFWYWDLEKPDEEWMSPEFWELLGIDPSTKDHDPKEWQDIIFPEDRDLALANFEKHCADPNHPYDQVVRYRHADGSTVWVRCRGLAIRGEKGKPIRMLGVHSDLTPLKRAEEALAEANERLGLQLRESKKLVARLDEANRRFDLALSGASVGIWDWIDVTSDEEYWSSRFYELLGYEDGEFTASLSAFEQHLHPDDRERTFAAVERHIEHGEPFDIEYRLRTKPGDYRWFRGTGMAARDARGKTTRMVGSIQDIDSRIVTNKLLERANEDLEQFAHIAAHDLREPARRQRMLINFALEDHADSIPPELKGDLERIRNQSDAMLAMITGFRALTGFRGAAVVTEPIDLSAVMEGLVAEIASDDDYEITCTVNVPEPVVCYPSLFDIMARNLLKNAIRHGTRPLTVSCHDEWRQGVRWFVFANSWDGDPATVTNEMFKPFIAAGENAGSGLGLSICKRVVDHHRGRIVLEPESGWFKVAFSLGESS